MQLLDRAAAVTAGCFHRRGVGEELRVPGLRRHASPVADYDWAAAKAVPKRFADQV